jgi:cellulose synthase/poly-beta-1,6-N-acetylglucosamine synthase-like glycosyltransferase
MLFEFFEKALAFYRALTPGEFFRLFWLFFVFEFTRYILFDYVILAVYYIDHALNFRKFQRAKSLLWQERPLVSVVVPGKNEGRNFYKLTRTLAEQSYHHYELIVVDDGSDDDTALIGRNLEQQGFIDRFLRNELRGGKASGANLGIRYAKGEFIIHVDADTSLNVDAIEQILIGFYKDPKVGGIGGNLKVRNIGESIPSALQAIEYLKTISIGRVITSYLGIYQIISGAFGAFRKDALERVKGYDIGPGLDGDITVKLRKMGYRIKFTPDAIAQTHVPTSFFKLMNQRLRWSKSLVRFRMRKHADVYNPNQNFNFSNFFSFLENLFYNLIINIAWFLYIIEISLNFTGEVQIILLINYCLYALSNVLQILAIGLFDRNPLEKLKLMIFVPLVPLYTGIFLRLVRTTAYLQEFFYKKSYEDPWNPPKSSRYAKAMRI